MGRSLEFKPSEEVDVVTRILVSVHQAIDQNFAHAASAPKRFSKTSFSDQLEETNLNIPQNEAALSQAVTRERSLKLKTPPHEENLRNNSSSTSPTLEELPPQTPAPLELNLDSTTGETKPLYQSGSPSQLSELSELGEISGRKMGLGKRLLIFVLILIAVMAFVWFWLRERLNLPVQ